MHTSQNKIELDPNIEENILSEPYFTLENIFSDDIFIEYEDHELDVPAEYANNNIIVDENRNENENYLEGINMNTNENENYLEDINMNTNENEYYLEDINMNTDNVIGVKRNRTSQEEKWKRKNNKHKRMTGQEYIGFQRKGKVVEHNVVREPRSLGDMCTSRFCLKAVNRFCNQFDESQRKEIFFKFWNSSWEEKKIYVLSLVITIEPKRDTTGNI
ncbi:uncharacterized protein LOC112602254 isoform X2 [Melanaphis sacchari]|nr:uncharacterized protein LOC112602254 isoform X2 [Melanaphis sacchari]